MTERWTLEKEFRFEASHQLKHHDGKCARLHGHSWVGRVGVSGTHLFQHGPKQGMLFDYADLSSIIKPLVERSLDHWHLNDTLLEDSPTSEMVARWVWVQVAAELLKLTSSEELLDSLTVTINETCTSSCKYSVDRGT